MVQRLRSCSLFYSAVTATAVLDAALVMLCSFWSGYLLLLNDLHADHDKFTAHMPNSNSNSVSCNSKSILHKLPVSSDLRIHYGKLHLT